MTDEELDALVSRANHEADLDICGEGYISPTVVWGMIDAIAALRADRATLLAEAEARGRLAEREAIAEWCADEANNCDDAAKWGGARQYVANCKAAAYALRNACNVIRARGNGGGGE